MLRFGSQLVDVRNFHRYLPYLLPCFELRNFDEGVEFVAKFVITSIEHEVSRFEVTFEAVDLENEGAQGGERRLRVEVVDGYQQAVRRGSR